MADLVNFEGNANAIRVLTHQQNGKDEGGTQLTLPLLASIAKYPCEAIAKKKDTSITKKFGFSKAKRDFLDIAKSTKMVEESGEPTIFFFFKRHPFVWLVEAADDICYNIIDMEDAHRLGIILPMIAKNLFIDLIKSVNKTEERKVNEKLSFISNKTKNFLSKSQSYQCFNH